MENETPVVEAQVVQESEKEVNVPSNVETITKQKANFQAQLDQVKKNLAQYQQAFEVEKTKGIRLEGAIESLDILLKSLQK